jgi:hypothetical protein
MNSKGVCGPQRGSYFVVQSLAPILGKRAPPLAIPQKVYGCQTSPSSVSPD